MKISYIVGGILLLIVLLVLVVRPSVPTAETLIAQLNGDKCKFELKSGVAVKRYFFSGFTRRSDAERCIIDAAQLLASMHSTNPAVVPALIEALKNNPNIDSGDGIIEVRSEIALALGRVGDKRALEPLQEILNSEDPVVLSKTGGFPANYEIQKGTSYEAVRRAIAEINQQ